MGNTYFKTNLKINEAINKNMTVFQNIIGKYTELPVIHGIPYKNNNV